MEPEIAQESIAKTSSRALKNKYTVMVNPKPHHHRTTGFSGYPRPILG